MQPADFAMWARSIMSNARKKLHKDFQRHYNLKGSARMELREQRLRKIEQKKL